MDTLYALLTAHFLFYCSICGSVKLNLLKNCVIIAWLLLMKLKCTFKYEKKLDILTSSVLSHSRR